MIFRFKANIIFEAQNIYEAEKKIADYFGKGSALEYTGKMNVEPETYEKQVDESKYEKK